MNGCRDVWMYGYVDDGWERGRVIRGKRRGRGKGMEEVDDVFIL